MQAKQTRSDILYMTTLDTGRCSHMVTSVRMWRSGAASCKCRVPSISGPVCICSVEGLLLGRNLNQNLHEEPLTRNRKPLALHLRSHAPIMRLNKRVQAGLAGGIVASTKLQMLLQLLRRRFRAVLGPLDLATTRVSQGHGIFMSLPLSRHSLKTLARPPKTCGRP